MPHCRAALALAGSLENTWLLTLISGAAAQRVVADLSALD